MREELIYNLLADKLKSLAKDFNIKIDSSIKKCFIDQISKDMYSRRKQAYALSISRKSSFVPVNSTWAYELTAIEVVSAKILHYTTTIEFDSVMFRELGIDTILDEVL